MSNPHKYRGKRDTGATLIEYALLAALIAVVVLASVTFMGGRISAQMSDNAGQFVI